MPVSELSNCDQVDSIITADNVMPVDSGDPSLVEVSFSCDTKSTLRIILHNHVFAYTRARNLNWKNVIIYVFRFAT